MLNARVGGLALRKRTSFSVVFHEITGAGLDWPNQHLPLVSQRLARWAIRKAEDLA